MAVFPSVLCCLSALSRVFVCVCVLPGALSVWLMVLAKGRCPSAPLSLCPYAPLSIPSPIAPLSIPSPCATHSIPSPCALLPPPHPPSLLHPSVPPLLFCPSVAQPPLCPSVPASPLLAAQSGQATHEEARSVGLQIINKAINTPFDLLHGVSWRILHVKVRMGVHGHAGGWGLQTCKTLQ